MRLLVILLALGLAVVPTPAAWVESLYSRRAYLLSQNVLTPLSSLTGFALFDVFMLTVVVGFPIWWVLTWRRFGSGRRWRAVGQMTFDMVTVLSAVYLVFLVVWGFNYRREPLTAKLDFDQRRVTDQALTELASTAVARLNGLHADAHREPWSGLDGLPDRMGAAFREAQTELGAERTAVTGNPKPTLLTPYFRRAGIDGMINPFSLEVLVNSTVLEFERPFVVAHEWAHLAGYADESEASFVGWLTCLRGDAASRYSGWLFLTPHLVGHLDRDSRAEMWDLMDDGPLADLRAVSERVSAIVPVVRQNANRVYDSYLKANRVDAGIDSYGLVVDLVLGSRLGQVVSLSQERPGDMITSSPW